MTVNGAGAAACWRAVGAVALVAVLSTPVSAVAQSAPPADPAAEAVARPLSPGAVALLLPHAATPAVRAD